jgi:MFS family permease
MERVIVPLLGSTFYHISSFIVIMSFIATFGFTKAFLDTVAGRWSDKIGRKPVLVLGWLLGIPIPFMLIYAPNWGWVVLANVLMGFNQALSWTMTVTSKVDIVGPKNRGLALGINEFSGYVGQASGVLITGFLAASFGLRPIPFYFGLATVILGLIFSALLAKETVGYTRLEEAGSRNNLSSNSSSKRTSNQPRSFYEIFSLTSWRNKTLFSCSQAGLVEKFTDTLLWGGFPLLLATRGIDIVTMGLIVGSYQIVWGVSQLFTGALSDRIGRRLPISIGMWIMGFGLVLAAVENSIISLYAASVITGFGMALVYPVLLASVSDVALPSERGTSLGVYRFWRDSGYGFGAILIGFVADAAGILSAFYLCALALFVSGLIAVGLMKETVQK